MSGGAAATGTALPASSTTPARRGPTSERVVLAVTVALFAAVGLVPVLRLADAALRPAGVFDAAPFLAEIATRRAALALRHSLETSLLGGFGALVIGGMVALAAALTDVRAVRPIAFLYVLSMLMAPQVTALAFLTATGPSSPLLNSLGLAPAPGSANPLTGPAGIIALLALHHSPLVFILLRTGLASIPGDVIEAARISGARPTRIARTIVLPLMRPYLAAAAALAFVACVGNFGIPALLGISVNYLTLPTLIYVEISSGGPAVLADMAALSVVMAAMTLAGLAVAGLVAPGRATRIAPGAGLGRPFRLGSWRLPVEAALWLLVAIVFVLPVASLVTTALVPAYGVALTSTTLTLDNFVEVLVRQRVTARALVNSGLYAGLAAALLALAAIPAAHVLERRGGRLKAIAETLIELPYALPGIVLAVATILLFLKPLPLVGVSLYATPAIIVVAYLIRFATVALKAPAAAMAQLPTDIEEAARIAGAGYARRLWTIVAPLIAPAAVAGALTVFLTAFNELTVSALLWSAGTETLGVVMFNLEDGGYATLAAAVAVVSIGVIAVAMIGLDLCASRLPRRVVPWR